MTADARPTFAPPGPGQWNLDRSHYPGGATPISQALMEACAESGLRRAMSELGAPIDTIATRFVNGFMYTRTVPLIGQSRSATKVPPLFILKAVSRVHPEFRRRTKIAANVLQHPPGPAVVERWNNQLKPTIVKRNNAFAAVSLPDLDASALGQHCADLLDYLHEMFDLHFWLHGYDLGPIARFVALTASSGIPTAEAVSLLSGASPSTVVPRQQLASIRAAIDDVSPRARPTSLADLRTLSPKISTLIDAYLASNGATLATGYDLTALTLGEMPETLFDSIMHARPVHEEPPAQFATRVESFRQRIPADRRVDFDNRLAEAREVMDMRDDNGPNVVERPIGLLRLALLEAGRRLASDGRVARAEHALELKPDEVQPLIATGVGPSSSELAVRAAQRTANAKLAPPLVLGPIEPTPPASALPGPLAEFAVTVQTAMDEMGLTGATNRPDPLSGTGVGTSTYRGRARRSESAEQAIDEMEPGDVLIVRATSPAFNVVLSIAGAVVTADGGPLSHAAVLARELGISAVVGASGALEISDGALVEVDPVAGVVRVLAEGPSRGKLQHDRRTERVCYCNQRDQLNQ